MITRLGLWPIISILIWGLLGLSLSFASEQSIGPRKNLFKVDEILIEGTKKVEAEAILDRISAKVGSVLDNYTLKQDIERIYALKFFETVEAYREERKGNDVLIFKVKEKPIVSSIILDGNSEISDDIQKQLKTKAFNILDINTVKTDVQALQKLYEEKGFYLATVTYEIKSVSEESVDLVFKISEMDKVVVKKITFLGNRTLTDNELKSQMETREESLFSWLSGSGSFKEFNFQTDIERLKFYYKTQGFLQVFVDSPQVTVSEDRRWIFITVKINEGPKFDVNNIYFQGELLFSESELLEKMKLKSGDVYSELTLREDIQTLTELYQDEGYAFANVLRTLDIVPGENKVDITFSFEKGRIVHFGKITMKGNTKTRDKVIRRELRVTEGMRYSGSLMRQSRENVNRLGFFEPSSVVFNTVSPIGQDDILDLEIQVQERNTGQISLGAGYSTATKGFLQASISQNNFRGLGQILSFSLNLSSTTQNYQLSFTEPYLLDTKWTAGGDVYFTTDTRSVSYDEKRRGFSTRVGHPIFDFTRLFLTYKFEDTELTNVRDTSVNANVENGMASGVEASLIHDKRNNIFEPSGGYYNSLSAEYVGLGFDKKWVRAVTDNRYYKTIVGDLVLRSRLYGARLFVVDGEPIPRSEKFFLGGPRNLRGFAYEDIGPKKDGTFIDENGNVIATRFNERGLFSLFSTIEFEHPLVREAGLKWVAFFDAGNIWDRYMGDNDSYSLRMNYGFGFRWFSPIGVLRFEFGYPLNKRADEASSQFHFDIGQLF
jgi:outer membrane protein insertion porin family